MATTRRRRIVAVHWEDAASKDEWTPAEEAEAFGRRRHLAITVGMLQERTRQHVVVVTTEDFEGSKAGLWKIPRGMVDRIETIGFVKVPA